MNKIPRYLNLYARAKASRLRLLFKALDIYPIYFTLINKTLKFMSEVRFCLEHLHLKITKMASLSYIYWKFLDWKACPWKQQTVAVETWHIETWPLEFRLRMWTQRLVCLDRTQTVGRNEPETPLQLKRNVNTVCKFLKHMRTGWVYSHEPSQRRASVCLKVDSDYTTHNPINTSIHKNVEWYHYCLGLIHPSINK